MPSTSTPLSFASTAERVPLHNRRIELQGYRRTDGLWDIEGELLDVKQYDYVNSEGIAKEAGTPLHNMKVRVAVDASMTVREIDILIAAAPFSECQGGGEALKSLVGAKIGAGWRKAIEAVAGGTAGCTHLRELLSVMATAVFQTISHDLVTRNHADGKPLYASDTPPVHFGQCIAWDFDGPVIRRVAPRFSGYRANARDSGGSE